MLRVEGNGQSPFTSHYEPGQVIAVPNAHAEGKLQLPDGRLNALEQSGQVAFRYCDPEGNTGAGYPWNPNGAPGDIAGITNPRGNVLGMMPHPERCCEALVGGEDGRYIFESLLKGAAA